MKSIRFKQFFLCLSLVFIVMLVGGTFIIMSIRAQEITRLETELAAFAQMVYGELLANPDKREVEYAAELDYLTRTAASGIEAFILSKDGYNTDATRGQVLYKTTAITSAMLGRPAYDGGGLRADLFAASDSSIAYAHPYPYNPNLSLTVQNIIYVRISTAPVAERMAEVTRVVVYAVIAALFLTFLIGYPYASTFTGPIIALEKRAKALAAGSPAAAVQVKSDDEIGRLTRTFNEMAGELAATMEGITTEKNKMEILLFNMKDGVLAYDRHGNLIEANYCAEQMLGLKNIKNLTFLGMAKAAGLDIDEDSAKRLKDVKDTAVYVGDKYINLIFSPYYNKTGHIDGIVIVLQDITEHKRLDDLRKEFVANVSHEIRTPLTTIKSYAETLLLSGDRSDIERGFLETIDKEADRMTVLVNDLLVLSRFDSNQLDLDIKMCDLDEIIQTALGQIEVMAEKKGQTIQFIKHQQGASRRVKDQKRLIKADKARVNQVFVNVLSNAVKYSPENTQVTVSVDQTDRFYRVYVKDEGFGIPKEDLARIFERFYRVDKARSREMGGTGLGLSIAKEIMEAHGFRISANSELGAGTTMIMRFERHRSGGS